ncbi:hypothetical protein BKA69DRAFT_760045 [Paraphysoderma sedebokerense]|nr:hypothetical protein BKA69DRAFT_760045 [Paraphysoderma sedebokerense]
MQRVCQLRIIFCGTIKASPYVVRKIAAGFCGPLKDGDGQYRNDANAVITEAQAFDIYCLRSQGDWRAFTSAGTCFEVGLNYGGVSYPARQKGEPASNPSPAVEPTTGQARTNSTPIIIGSVVGVAALLALIFGFLVYRKVKGNDESDRITSPPNPANRFSLLDLEKHRLNAVDNQRPTSMSNINSPITVPPSTVSSPNASNFPMYQHQPSQFPLNQAQPMQPQVQPQYFNSSSARASGPNLYQPNPQIRQPSTSYSVHSDNSNFRDSVLSAATGMSQASNFNNSPQPYQAPPHGGNDSTQIPRTVGMRTAKASYVPQFQDEIQVKPGDTLNIIEPFDDGWAYGESLTTGQKGIFPLTTLNANPEDLFLLSFEARLKNLYPDATGAERNLQRYNSLKFSRKN